MEDDDSDLSGLGVLILMLVLALVFIMFLVNTYLVVKWQHPDDGNDWMVAKVVVVLGMTIVELVVLGLPLDVNNGSGSLGCSYDWGDDSGCARLDMTAYWSAMFCLVLAWLVVCVPMCIFAYEATDEADRSGSARAAWCEAIKSELAMLAAFGIVVGCMFAFLNKFEIPFDNYRAPANTTSLGIFNASEGLSILDSMGDLDDVSATKSSRAARLPATFFAYATALTSWLGWFFFAIWGGIGLAALPLDLIFSFVHRPSPLGAAEVAEYRLQLAKRTEELVDIGKGLQTERADFVNQNRGSWWQTRKRNAADRIRLNKLKQMVYILETEVEEFVLCSKHRDQYDPLVYVGYLVLGIIALVHSLLWIAHTVLFRLVEPPVTPFLNDYLLQFEKWYPLFGALACILFSVYLLLATVKGCFKFGMRFFLLDIHPMKLNATYMNHMLFNISLFLLCAFPVAQFATLAFAYYSQFTDAATLFFAIERLTFFRLFFDFKIFEFALVAFFGVSTIYLLFSPRDEPASAAKLRATLQRNRGMHSTTATFRNPAHNLL